MFRRIISMLCLFILFSGQKGMKSFEEFVKNFSIEYKALNIPDFQYDYRNYFNSILPIESLEKQENYFISEKKALIFYSKAKLNIEEKIIYDHMLYELDFNLQRIMLEKEWIQNGKKVPINGLHSLANGRAWYKLFIKKFTGLDLNPEEIMKTGLEEVDKVKKEIKKIQLQSGLDSVAFYNYLKSDSFFITDKEKLIAEFNKTRDTINNNLKAFIGDVNLPEVYPIEWANADANTPPGIYINHENNPYGKDVFQFNFYGKKFNSRSIEWIYMHEAIPGHHLQISISDLESTDSLQDLFLYPGTFEGWACYVEYEGKKMGLYKNIYSYLGKWEWDLIRSARLVIDAGIHYYGWTDNEARAYWKKNISGQDEISDREITRVTNWTAQALSYKLGANCIRDIREDMKKKYGNKYDEVKFNRCYVSFGMRPLEVIKDNFEISYKAYKEFMKK
jgi:uncharacterized protein (DUF885 family)